MPPLPLPIPSGPARRALIDEYGDLAQKIEAFKPTKDRQEQLRGQIQSWYDAHPADKPFIEEGLRYSLEISEKANKRTIVKMTALFKILGQRMFLKLCGFALKDVDENIPVTRHREFLVEEQTGSRKLKAVAKAALPADLKKAA